MPMLALKKHAVNYYIIKIIWHVVIIAIPMAAAPLLRKSAGVENIPI
jgi:hypothetical protein